MPPMRLVVALLACAAASGCAIPGPGQDSAATPGPSAAAPAEPPGWFARRGRDLLAIFDGDLSFGPGIGVRAAVTRHAQLGFMFLGPSESSMITPTTALLVGKRGEEFGTWRIAATEYGLSPWYPSDATLQEYGADAKRWRGDLAQTRGTQFSVQLHLALIGVEFGFDPVALGRFLSGLVGYEGEPDPIQ